MKHVKGVKRVTTRVRDLSSPGARAAVYRGVYAAADMIRTDAALSISKGAPKTVDAEGKKQHTPSKPGDPPNRDTAQLDTSIVTEGNPDRLSADASANTPYAAALEFGSPENNLEPRPYMRPAAQKHRENAAKLIAASLAKHTKKRRK